MNDRPGKVELLLRAWGFGDSIVKHFEEQEIDEEAFDCLDRPLIQQLFKTVGAQAKFLKHYNVYIKDKKSSDITEIKAETVEQTTQIKTENNEDEEDLQPVSIVGIESLAKFSSWTPPETSNDPNSSGFSSNNYFAADLHGNGQSPKRRKVVNLEEDIIERNVFGNCANPSSTSQAEAEAAAPPQPAPHPPAEAPVRVSAEEARPEDIFALSRLLEINASGCLLYKRRNEVLSVRDRRRLADIIVNHEMGGRTNSCIPPKRLEQLSRAICVLFTKESQAAYFTPYFSMNETRVLQGGALTTAHLALRREINKNKNGGRVHSTGRPTELSVEQQLSGGVLSPAVEADIAFLKNNIEPWEKIEAKWKTTFEARKKCIEVDQTKKPGKLSNADLKSILRAEKADKLSTYFEDFKALQQPSGYLLLEQDFANLYPEKGMTFFINWKPFCDKAITALRNTTSLPAEWKKNVDVLVRQLDSGGDIDYVRLLMSLSGLVPTATAVNRTATRPLWRPSKHEIQAGFVTHVKTYSDIGTEIRKRHEKFQVFDQTVQPFVILVGESLDWIEASYIVIDKQLYHLESPVRALEVGLKSHFALGVPYTVESKALWLLVQVYLFEIRTEVDKLYQCASVIKVLSDFGLEL